MDTAQQSIQKKITPTGASLLGFLLDGPQTGWTLIETVQQRIGAFWSLTTSQVYAELDKLAGQGLLREGERGKRNSRTFAITAAGRKVFEDWTAQLPPEEQIRFPLLLEISFARFVKQDDLVDHIAVHRDVHSRRLGQYKSELAELPESDNSVGARLTLQFGISYERVVLDWLEQVKSEVTARAARVDMVAADARA